MSTKMSIDEQKMLNYYEKLMDQVYLLYHQHPTNLVHVNLTDAEKAEQGYNAAMAKQLGSQMQRDAQTYIDRYGSNAPAVIQREMAHYKCAIHQHSELSNGLKRR